MWYQDIRAMLEEMGYTHLESDHAVFIRVRDGTFSIIALYVDDISMASNDPNAIEQDKLKLKQKYQMMDLGDISWILGMHITRDREKGTIVLSQQQYAEDVLQKFGKADVRPISTPALTNEHLIKLDSPEIDAKSYQRAVRALMYLTLGTRPDLSYAVGVLGRYSANLGPDHQRALDRVFKYLRATSDRGLVFQQGTEKGLTLEGYADVDWANDVNDRWSTSGYVFMLAGAAVSWSSKKQMSVALSSTEAEYIAGAHAAKELIWLRQLLAGLGFATNSPTTLLMDNQSAIAIAKNPTHHERTKHIEVRYHFLKRMVEDGKIKLEYVPTMEQPADAMTKGLARKKHELFIGQMGLCRLG
jgi:Reverse transcriptase (RNA-dependent DNA polymerase)